MSIFNSYLFKWNGEHAWKPVINMRPIKKINKLELKENDKINAIIWKCEKCNKEIPCFLVSICSRKEGGQPTHCIDDGLICEWIKVEDTKELKEYLN